MISSGFRKLAAPLTTIFPGRCVSCGATAHKPPGDVLCARCLGEAKYPDKNICCICGRALDFDYELETGETYRCGACLDKKPPFEQLRFAVVYEGPVRELFHAFKFQSQRRLAGPLARMGIDRLEPWFREWPDAVIIPVPLAVGKLFTRGYNPSYLLARIFADWAGQEIAEGAIRRVRATAPQFGLNKKERIKNVKGAFGLHQPNIIKGRRVILFDDIHTTGATVLECCKVLKKAKPAAIRVATLCRAGRS